MESLVRVSLRLMSSMQLHWVLHHQGASWCPRRRGHQPLCWAVGRGGVPSPTSMDTYRFLGPLGCLSHPLPANQLRGRGMLATPLWWCHWLWPVSIEPLQDRFLCGSIGWMYGRVKIQEGHEMHYCSKLDLLQCWNFNFRNSPSETESQEKLNAGQNKQGE